MTEKIFDLQATPKLMPRILSLAEEHGLTASLPMAKDSSSDALDAPLGVDEVRQVMEVITLIASTGTTVVGFLAALKLLIGQSEEDDGKEPKVEVLATESQKKLGTVTADCDTEKIKV